MTKETKIYLGDGIYAEFDGVLVLTTEDGRETTNQIIIDASIWRKLLKWVETMERS